MALKEASEPSIRELHTKVYPTAILSSYTTLWIKLAINRSAVPRKVSKVLLI
jgi:hypothetical protein